MVWRISLLFFLGFLTGCRSLDSGSRIDRVDEGSCRQEFLSDHGQWSDRQRYVAYSSSSPLTIDGRLDEAAWQAAPQTATFVDIQGAGFPVPLHRTTAKMLWDADYFYIGATLEEPHLWATLTERDSVIFKDNDFEVFIDPDGDTHRYYELEINALCTEWDLLLEKPYRDGGPAVNAFDTAGLRSAVSLGGTINDPSDRDSGWSVEIAIPWEALHDMADCPLPPLDGDVWWVNFSRVQWSLDVQSREGDVRASYVKRTDEAGATLPEDNWVWSPQGVIAMHEPESWGLVMFAKEQALGRKADRIFVDPVDLRQRETLHRIYKAQHRLHDQRGTYSSDLQELGLARDELEADAFELFTTEEGFQAVLIWSGGEDRLHIDQSGHLW